MLLDVAQTSCVGARPNLCNQTHYRTSTPAFRMLDFRRSFMTVFAIGSSLDQLSRTVRAGGKQTGLRLTWGKWPLRPATNEIELR